MTLWDSKYLAVCAANFKEILKVTSLSPEISTQFFEKILDIFAFYCTSDIVKEWVLVLSQLVEIVPEEYRLTRVSDIVLSYTKPN